MPGLAAHYAHSRKRFRGPVPAPLAQEGAASLQHLPVELLLEIHLHSLSSHLPIVSRHLQRVFASTSTDYRVSWLLRAVAGAKEPSAQLERIATYPLCTTEVYDDVLTKTMWPLRLSKLVNLPRRFAKDLTASTSVDGIFRQLVMSELFDVNAHRGYTLARAVFVGHKELMELLLERGGDASCNNDVAVIFAIRKKHLPLVKRLVQSPSYARSAIPCKMRTKDNRPLWMSDGQARHLMDEAMKVKAADIVQWLQNDLGATPSMDTLRKL